MSIVEMQKVHIVSTKNNQDQLIKQLEKAELIHIQSIGRAEEPVTSDKVSQLEYKLAEIKSAITFLEGIAQQKKSFIESFLPPKELIKEAELLQACRGSNCQQIIERSKQIADRLANLKNLANELLTQKKLLLPWQGIDLQLNSFSATVKIIIAPGKIKTSLANTLIEELKNTSSATDISIVKKEKEATYLIVTYLHDENQLIGDLLTKVGFEPIALPETKLTALAEQQRLSKILADVCAENNELLAEAKKLAEQLNKTKYMYDLIFEQKANQTVKQNFADTNYTFIIEGWIKKQDLNKIRSVLNKITREFDVFEVEPAEGEKPPVVLKNPHAFSPFELITKIYGTPKSDEWDPSIALSFFFALFFGICLGDFGYGLILAGFAYYFLKKHRLPEGGRNLFKLLMFGGGVAAVVGILTGSYLGFTPKEIPVPWLTSLQIIDPIKSPLVMLLFALTLGVVQILLGIILQMALRIRNKEYVSALLDDGTWLFFLSSLVFLIVASALGLPLAGLASKMSIAGAVSLILTQGRHKKNIFEKFFSGLLSLYKVSGYMGDTLSYSRLLALGMSTTIIGSVINILAGMLRGIPVLGILLMIVLLIFGHLFNLVIGTLSAFVHSTRLQMVEFFSKFYEGGGREFKPFKREAEFTIIK